MPGSRNASSFPTLVFAPVGGTPAFAQMYFNGSASAGLTINLTGSVVDGDVYVVAQSNANATILAQADQSNGAGWFNGHDAVVLRKGTTMRPTGLYLDKSGRLPF